MFILSYIFIVATVILAVLCRLNFGTEVMHHLRTDKGEKATNAPLPVDEKGNLKRLTLGNSGRPFVLTLPRPDHVHNPPRRWASLSSASSSKGKGSRRTRISSAPIVAAQPGAIRIAPPVQAATPTVPIPANPVSSAANSARKQGPWPFWWRNDKRHESTISFGHMDPSRLTIASSVHAPDLPRNPHTQPSTTDALAVPRGPSPSHEGSRVDSVGSIYSAQTRGTRLFLVTDL